MGDLGDTILMGGDRGGLSRYFIQAEGEVQGEVLGLLPWREGLWLLPGLVLELWCEAYGSEGSCSARATLSKAEGFFLCGGPSAESAPCFCCPVAAPCSSNECCGESVKK